MDVVVLNAGFQLSWMTLMYVLNMAFTNGSMVDFGWPSGFTIMALWYWSHGSGVLLHRLLLCPLYVICGVRFMCGWIMRGHLTREDHRWQHWRTHWQENGGFFRSHSIPFNFFCFYHCQSLTNVLFMSVPLHIASMNNATEASYCEYVGVALWLLGFCFENIADHQLNQWKMAKKSGVLREGLWRYCRHPNYFGEFLIWISYAIMTFSAESSLWQQGLLLMLPCIAYYYLVYFTGAWMAEQVSLKKRGESYARYQAETNLLFPWFPKEHQA